VTNQSPVLVVDDIVAGYLPGVDVVRHCSLVVERGDCVGIIGPNGAGKSTLLKAMFGLVPVREGSVQLNGENVTNFPAHELVARRVGYVPQVDNVFPSLTVEENLRIGIYQHRRRWEERFGAVAAIFPLLADRRRQPAGLLSGGERQMLAIGRALMSEPLVLLLDEPSAGLSPINQELVFERTVEINRSGISIVMVEQNAQRCLEIAHRGYVLDQGSNAYTGLAQDLLHDPRVVELYLGQLAGRSEHGRNEM